MAGAGSARLLLLAWAAWLAIAAGAPAAPQQAVQPPDAGPLVCIIIRTYWGHGSYGNFELWKLFHSLKRQTHVK
jgi:hypothetical protein